MLYGYRELERDLEARGDRILDGSDHAHRILDECLVQGDQGDDSALIEVLQGIVEVYQIAFDGVVIEAVDGEVAARGILLDRAEFVVGRAFVLLVAAECGDLDDLLAECDVDYAETPSDDSGVVE